MHSNNRTDELSIDSLKCRFDSRSFFMSLRRQNETHREIYTLEHDRHHPLKYSAFDHRRGFTRFDQSHSFMCDKIISNHGIMLTNTVSQQLLDDNLSIVRHRWQRSKILFSDKIQCVQSNLSTKTNLSLKRTVQECQEVLFNWISKNRLG